MSSLVFGLVDNLTNLVGHKAPTFPTDATIYLWYLLLVFELGY